MAGPRFQFSIRRLLALTAVAAAVTAASAGKPSRFSGAMLVLLAISFPAVFTVGLIHKNRLWVAICAGAMLPAALGLDQLIICCSYNVQRIGITPGVTSVMEALDDELTNGELRSHVPPCWIPMILMGLTSAAVWSIFYSNAPRTEKWGEPGSPSHLVPSCLIVAVAIAGIAVALLSGPNRFSGAILALLAIAIPASFAAALAGDGCRWKAFSAGAIVPAGIAFFRTWQVFFLQFEAAQHNGLASALVEKLFISSSLRIYCGLSWTAMLATGLISAVVYRPPCCGQSKED